MVVSHCALESWNGGSSVSPGSNSLLDPLHQVLLADDESTFPISSFPISRQLRPFTPAVQTPLSSLTTCQTDSPLAACHSVDLPKHAPTLSTPLLQPRAHTR